MSVCLNYLFSYPACKSRVLCAVLLSVACPAVSHFSTLSHERYDFRGGGGLLNVKCLFVLIFSTAPL